MFHTWESAQYSTNEQTDAAGGARRRTSTTRACEPCRRRKIRCNGEHPCETCIWYRKAASCHYTENRQKKVANRRDVDSVSNLVEDYSAVLQTLFPTTSLEQLKKMPREQLLERLANDSPSHLQPASPITPGLSELQPTVSPDAANLEELQPMPEEGTDGTESRTSGIGGITDDINALSLSIRKSSSYLGISSVMAVLRVILWLDPGAQDYFTKTPNMSHVPSREPSVSPDEEFESETENKSKHKTPSAWSEIPLINSYFDYIHPFVPLIDEQYFRNTYIAQKRKDPRWLLLLNTVLALGGMAAASSCEDMSHVLYWKHASQYLTVETLGSVHIETVQALSLLGGYYLHYLNKPLVANNLMGATLRIATALGLHRDYPEAMNRTGAGTSASYNIEMRRRVWWNLFIMDAWHGAALGRPSMGRMSPAISAKAPQEHIDGSADLLAIMQDNIRFCMLSTKMEDALAVSPLIAAHERKVLDDGFVAWYNASSLLNTTPRANNQTGGSSVVEPQGITMSRNVMRWRYLLWRIIIHRPVLLWYAMARIPFSSLPPDKKAAITLCRELAGELIADIAGTWKGRKAQQMSGWNATWNLYQTLMVPLLSLYSDPSDSAVVTESRRLVELGLDALLALRGWSNIAQRSYEVVSRIYEASKRHRPQQQGLEQGQGLGLQQQQQQAHSASASASVAFPPPPPSQFRSSVATATATTLPAPNTIHDPSQFMSSSMDSSSSNSNSNNPHMGMGMGMNTHEMLVDDMFDSLNWGSSIVTDAYDQFGPPSDGSMNNSYSGFVPGGGGGYGFGSGPAFGNTGVNATTGHAGGGGGGGAGEYDNVDMMGGWDWSASMPQYFDPVLMGGLGDAFGIGGGGVEGGGGGGGMVGGGAGGDIGGGGEERDQGQDRRDVPRRQR